MRRGFLPFCLLIATVGTSAQAATRTYPVGGFDRVRTTVPFDVQVHTGAAPAVHATGGDDVLARLHIAVIKGELQITTDRQSWFQNFSWRKREHVLINVAVPRLAGVTLTGPGNLNVDTVRSPGFTASLSGPGNIVIGSIEAGRLDLAVSGPGDLTLAGRAGSARIVGRGPGDVRASRLVVDDAIVDLTGPGDVSVTARRFAKVSLTGPGDVKVLGRPRCEISKHGPGDVICGG